MFTNTPEILFAKELARDSRLREAKRFYYFIVAFLVVFFQEVEQLFAPGDHFQEPPPRGVVFGMGFEV